MFKTFGPKGVYCEKVVEGSSGKGVVIDSFLVLPRQ